MLKLSWCPALLCSIALLLPGCKQKPEDEVIAQYKRSEEAIALGNAAEYRDTMTAESMGVLTEAKRLALECPEKECKSLSPHMLNHVIGMRNRLSASELRAMDADRILQWYMDQGMFTVDSEMDIFPHKVSIQGDQASIQMGYKVEDSSRPRGFGRGRGAIAAVSAIASIASGPKTEPIPGYVIYYKNLNGYWYQDAIASANSRRSLIEMFAREADMSVPNFLLEIEKEEFGSIKPDIWKPMK